MQQPWCRPRLLHSCGHPCSCLGSFPHVSVRDLCNRRSLLIARRAKPRGKEGIAGVLSDATEFFFFFSCANTNVCSFAHCCCEQKSIFILFLLGIKETSSPCPASLPSPVTPGDAFVPVAPSQQRWHEPSRTPVFRKSSDAQPVLGGKPPGITACFEVTAVSGTLAGGVNHIRVVFPVHVPHVLFESTGAFKRPTLEVSNLTGRCRVPCLHSQCSMRANVPVLALDNWYFLIMTREKFFVQPKPECGLLAPERKSLTAAFGQETVF